MERTVIVLDSFEYKLKEKELQKSIENICNPTDLRFTSIEM